MKLVWLSIPLWQFNFTKTWKYECKWIRSWSATESIRIILNPAMCLELNGPSIRINELTREQALPSWSWWVARLTYVILNQNWPIDISARHYQNLTIQHRWHIVFGDDFRFLFDPEHDRLCKEGIQGASLGPLNKFKLLVAMDMSIYVENFVHIEKVNSFLIRISKADDEWVHENLLLGAHGFLTDNFRYQDNNTLKHNTCVATTYLHDVIPG